MTEQHLQGEIIWEALPGSAWDRLIISDDTVFRVPEGKVLLLEAGGVLQRPVAGTYEGQVQFHLVDTMETWGEMTGPYCSGLFFGENGLEAARSALSGWYPEGTRSVDGLALTLRGNCLNGISCTGGSTRIENAELLFQGNGDDFRLTGTAVAAGGTADVTIRNSSIRSKGVAATTVAVGGHADVLLDGCTLHGEGIQDDGYYLDNHHLTVVPWVLGLRGTVRASNLLEEGTVTYYNTAAYCNGWGVLSVDMTKNATHNLVNTDVSIPADSAYASGYGAYLLGGTTSTFLGCTFDVPDYVFAVGGNDYHTLVGPSSQENLQARKEQLKHLDREVGLQNIPERPCLVRAGKFAGMWHHQSTGTFEIRPGTRIQAGICAFLIKSGDRLNPPQILCDGASIEAPALVHLMESDDPGMGNYGRDKSWAPYYECIYAPEENPEHNLSGTPEGTARLTLRNMTVTGDCFNTKWKKAQNLAVTLDGATLTGRISSGRAIHRDYTWGIALDAAGNRVYTDKTGRPYITETVADTLFGKMPVTYSFPVRDDNGSPVYASGSDRLPMIGYAISETQPELLGDVDVAISEPVNNGILVELKNGSCWNVRAEGYITSLTIEAGCRLEGRLFVDGAETEARPGIYRGVIRVLPS